MGVAPNADEDAELQQALAASMDDGGVGAQRAQHAAVTAAKSAAGGAKDSPAGGQPKGRGAAKGKAAAAGREKAAAEVEASTEAAREVSGADGGPLWLGCHLVWVSWPGHTHACSAPSLVQRNRAAEEGKRALVLCSLRLTGQPPPPADSQDQIVSGNAYMLVYKCTAWPPGSSSGAPAAAAAAGGKGSGGSAVAPPLESLPEDARARVAAIAEEFEAACVRHAALKVETEAGVAARQQVGRRGPIAARAPCPSLAVPLVHRAWSGGGRRCSDARL
jgi:hypothetical protein